MYRYCAKCITAIFCFLAAFQSADAMTFKKCAQVDARYTSPGQPKYIIYFSVAGKVSSNRLVLNLRSGKTRKIYHFVFDTGSALKISLLPISNAELIYYRRNGQFESDSHKIAGTATFVGIKRGGFSAYELPQPKSAAFVYISIPEIGEWMRHYNENIIGPVFVLNKCI